MTEPNQSSISKQLFRRIFYTILLSSILAVYLGGWLFLSSPTLRSNNLSEASVPTKSLQAHVTKLAADFYPRNYQSLRNLERASDYIAEELTAAGAATEFQEFQVNGLPYRNVIGRIAGTTSSKKRIILGAHYDSCLQTPGADDNASGVAGLIELTRLLKQSPLSQEVEIVAYTLEEPPFFRTNQMGSFIHAKSIQREKSRVSAVVILEMIGYFSDERGSQTYPSPILRAWYPGRGNFVAVVGIPEHRALVKSLKAGMKGATALPVYSLTAPAALPGIDFSDHRNYWPHGISAVMVTDTAFYRNSRYHALTDVPQTLDYERMSQVVVAVFEALHKL